MRVVFACLPAYGHLQPMVALASACSAAGHEVLVATGPDMVPRARALGLDAAAVGPTRAQGEDLARRGPAATAGEPALRRVWDQYTFVHRFTTDGARLRAADLVPLVIDWHPDLVVHDVTDFAAPFAAAVLGVPSALHSWGPPLPARLMARAGVKAALLWTGAGLDPPTAGGMHRGVYLDLCPPALRPDDAGDIPRVQPLRPMPPVEDRLALPAEIDRLPYERTVHLTLGTVANRSLGTFRDVLDATRDLRVNVVVTVGPDQDPAVLGELAPQVYAAAYLPIDLTLARCDAVIAHGGSGTMLAALRHGLPQLIIPYDGDNVRNARLCEDAGAALQLPPRDLVPDSVRTAVSQLLDDPSLRTSAQRVRDQIRAMPPPHEVVPVLERLAAGEAMPGA